eukprot:301707-Prorocentrum_minimum.AAC.1
MACRRLSKQVLNNSAHLVSRSHSRHSAMLSRTRSRAYCVRAPAQGRANRVRVESIYPEREPIARGRRGITGMPRAPAG